MKDIQESAKAKLADKLGLKKENALTITLTGIPAIDEIVAALHGMAQSLQGLESVAAAVSEQSAVIQGQGKQIADLSAKLESLNAEAVNVAQQQARTNEILMAPVIPVYDGAGKIQGAHRELTQKKEA